MGFRRPARLLNATDTSFSPGAMGAGKSTSRPPLAGARLPLCTSRRGKILSELAPLRRGQGARRRSRGSSIELCSRGRCTSTARMARARPVLFSTAACPTHRYCRELFGSRHGALIAARPAYPLRADRLSRADWPASYADRRPKRKMSYEEAKAFIGARLREIYAELGYALPRSCHGRPARGACQTSSWSA